MELNREQIIKALECCSHRPRCRECPYTTKECESLRKDALALIKELTEEVVDLKDIAEGYQKQFEDCYAENERLHASCTELEQVCKKWQGRLKIECEYTKADTVRKMQSEIKARCIEGGIYPAFVARVIDQIAKEMLEETTPTNNANTCICCGAIIPEGILTCPNCNEEK